MKKEQFNKLFLFFEFASSFYVRLIIPTYLSILRCTIWLWQKIRNAITEYQNWKKAESFSVIPVKHRNFHHRSVGTFQSALKWDMAIRMLMYLQLPRQITMEAFSMLIWAGYCVHLVCASATRSFVPWQKQAPPILNRIGLCCCIAAALINQICRADTAILLQIVYVRNFNAEIILFSLHTRILWHNKAC